MQHAKGDNTFKSNSNNDYCCLSDSTLPYCKYKETDSSYGKAVLDTTSLRDNTNIILCQSSFPSQHKELKTSFSDLVYFKNCTGLPLESG